jgi:c(7)-type cytochrome triheme protein
MPSHLRTYEVRRLKFAILLVLAVSLAYACSGPTDPAPEPEIKPAPEMVKMEMDPALDYSKFEHGSEQHTRLPCLICHTRNDSSTKPKLPGHLPCSGCHVQQFAQTSGPMCTVCHTDGTPAVKPFPPLASFSVKFDHAVHADAANCADCHQTSQRGVALSIPSRQNAHVTCFQCHGPAAESEGKDLASCSVCHEPGRPSRTSESAKAFSINFSHQQHTGRAGIGCSSCHTVRPGAGRGLQVSAPVAAMHFPPARTQSCASCHNNKRAFGPGDFMNCKRCHQDKTFKM